MRTGEDATKPRALGLTLITVALSVLETKVLTNEIKKHSA